MLNLATRILSFVHQAKDKLLPPTCPCCRSAVAQDYSVCHMCWANAHFITDPLCQLCGVPFAFSSNDALICAPCMKTPPLYERGRSVLVYDDFSKKLVLPFKHSDALHLGPLMAKWAVQCHPELFLDIDYIIPVPLHWRRLFERQYNQAAVLGMHLEKRTQVKHAPLLLQRVQDTPSQAGKSLKQRKENVNAAFYVNKPERLQDKSVLLVDDVFTTGATVEACCKALRKSGIRKIHVLTFARVLKPQDVL